MELTDQSSTFWNVKKKAHVNQRVNINMRKKANTYTRMRLLSRARFVVRDAQLRTADIDTRPIKKEGNDTTHIRFCY